MGISANDVKILRERSGAGMMDCKKALQEANGDIEKASEILREKGLAAAVKKAGRIAAEGVVESYILSGGKIGALVEVNCETDFVAKTEEFKTFVKDIAKQIAESDPTYVEADDTATDNSNKEKDKYLLDQQYIGDPAITVKEFVTQKIAQTGEKISIRRFTRYETNEGIVDSYIHMGGKIGVLVQVNCSSVSLPTTDGFKTFVRDIAMQIAAANPMYLNEKDIDPEVLAKEKEILTAQALNEGKPAHVVDKMVEGRIKKFKKEICLLDQPFVKDQDISIRELIDQKIKQTGETITIERFVRYEMGEGLEKRKDDFAKEVAEQAGL